MKRMVGSLLLVWTLSAGSSAMAQIGSQTQTKVEARGRDGASTRITQRSGPNTSARPRRSEVQAKVASLTASIVATDNQLGRARNELISASASLRQGEALVQRGAVARAS